LLPRPELDGAPGGAIKRAVHTRIARCRIVDMVSQAPASRVWNGAGGLSKKYSEVKL